MSKYEIKKHLLTLAYSITVQSVVKQPSQVKKKLFS